MLDRAACPLPWLLTALLASAWPQAAAAQATQGRMEVIVVRSLSFIKDDDLEFGTIIPGTTAGTVTVPPSGARTRTGGVTLAPSVFRPALFAGRGAVNQNVQISISSNSILLTRVGGTQTMVADTFTIGSSPTAVLTTAPRTFRITAASGVFNFAIGARLNVAANQAGGNYRGTFTITLNYQ